LFADISALTLVNARMKSILKASEAKRAGINMSPNPIIEKSCLEEVEPSLLMIALSKSLGKINFMGFSIDVATLTMTSEAKTKTQS